MIYLVMKMTVGNFSIPIFASSLKEKAELKITDLKSRDKMLFRLQEDIGEEIEERDPSPYEWNPFNAEHHRLGERQQAYRKKRAEEMAIENKVSIDDILLAERHKYSIREVENDD
jgi:hypothetical protein